VPQTPAIHVRLVAEDAYSKTFGAF